MRQKVTSHDGEKEEIPKPDKTVWRKILFAFGQSGLLTDAGAIEREFNLLRKEVNMWANVEGESLTEEERLNRISDKWLDGSNN